MGAIVVVVAVFAFVRAIFLFLFSLFFPFLPLFFIGSKREGSRGNYWGVREEEKEEEVGEGFLAHDFIERGDGGKEKKNMWEKGECPSVRRKNPLFERKSTLPSHLCAIRGFFSFFPPIVFLCFSHKYFGGQSATHKRT